MTVKEVDAFNAHFTQTHSGAQRVNENDRILAIHVDEMSPESPLTRGHNCCSRDPCSGDSRLLPRMYGCLTTDSVCLPGVADNSAGRMNLGRETRPRRTPGA